MRTRDIFLVDFNPAIGAEMQKTRPCIIVSNQDLGVLPLKIVVPLIGHKEIHNDKSWLVVVNPNELNGLSKVSTADTLNMRSVSDERIIKKIGVVDEQTYQRLTLAMRVVLDI
jgi:mRNA interferase MazF